ncbi:MAG: DUF6702 family protein [Gemmatimonadales bacterium]
MPAPWISLIALALAGARAHPMHTAVTELAQQDAAGHTAIQVRVYLDDLQAAVGASAGAAGADSAMSRYLRASFALADRTGRPVRLTWTGAERTGDVILLRLRGEVPGGLAGARVTSLVLCERFEDQVNVVRAVYAGRTTTLLFTRGETAKVLP